MDLRGWVGGQTFGHVRETRQELIEFLLAFSQFTSATVVDTETVHDAVDDKEAVLIACKRLCEGIEKLELMLQWIQHMIPHVGRNPHFTIERSCVHDVLLCFFRVDCGY